LDRGGAARIAPPATRREKTMSPTAIPASGPRLYLRAEKAADLMTPNPVSIREDASLREAIALLIDRGYSAAPVIDAAGHPVGVLSRTDILIHDRECVEHPVPLAEYYSEELVTDDKEPLGEGFQVECVDPTRVGDVMTPAVFAVGPEASPARVVREMLRLKVHRLFVVDGDGVLVGVISALDVLRYLQP
jgi:CBS-domain-containing membrane protein